MPTRPTTAAADRLRANPAFVQALSLDGRPCVAIEAEPSTQYWLNERERVLLSLFSARYGSTLSQATAAYFRLTGASDSPGERQRLGLTIQNLQAAGVLMAPGQDDSSHGAAHGADDLAQQPLPRDLATHIVERAGVTRGSRVLDLAGGPMRCAVDLDPKHPLLELLGRGAVWGLQQGPGFVADLERLQRRLSLLFEALGASEQPRHGACAPASHAAPGSQNTVAAGVSFFEQTRPFGPAQTRALVPAQQIATTGQSPAAFWRDLQARCAATPPAQLLGQHHWGVLHFRRGAAPFYPAQGQVDTGGTVLVTAAKAST